MSAKHSERGRQPDRRDFLKTAGVAAAGAMVLPHLDLAAQLPPVAGSAAAARAGWQVRPFALGQVQLGESLFTQKRDRMLNYLRNYGSATDALAGPDRLLSIFRANAGVDTKGAEPPGDWENETGYLRGHYAGHFMSALSQAAVSTGDDVFRRKLEYLVNGLAECQAALAAAAQQPTPRSAGKFGKALPLSGSPIGHAEHVKLPDGVVSGLHDFTIALWVKPLLYDPARLPGSRPGQGPETLTNGTAVFDFGRPNEAYAEPAQARMHLTLRVSNQQPSPRFAITTSGADGEQRLDAPTPLPADQWSHIAITRQGATGTLYINGSPVASNDGLTLSPADLGITSGNWLGRCQFPQRNISYLHAELDEFQVWDRALTAAELKSLLSSAGGSAGGGNVVWYRFDEPNGLTVTDSSGQGRHGTVIGPWDGRRHAGFLSAYPETQFVRLEEFATYGGSQGIWAPYYTLHKIMAGLLDAYAVTGNRQALDILTGIGDWASSRLLPLRPEQLDRMWNIYIAGEYGGVNESLAQLAALRPEKPEYLAAARQFDNRNVKDPTQENRDILDGRHANQHIPQFIGYLRLFEQSDSPDYYAAAKNFWDMVVPHRVYSHGGMGVGEMFRARDVIAGSLWQFPNDPNHAETCPLYNMLKLSRNLFFHEPDSKYMNYYEHGLFNQILASRRDLDSADSPEVTYFVPVRPGQRREYGNTGTCCGGTGMENHTKYQDSIYFRSTDDATLYVNLYIPSTLSWPEHGFTIEQATSYPLQGASTLTVTGSGRLAIKLRVPEWVRRGYTVRVNGRAQRLEATPGSYVTLDRQWRPGDRIEVSMPFSFRIERAIDDASVQSLFYGPTLLALQAAPVGNDLATGLIPLSLYRYMKLDGDVAAAMTPAHGPLQFTHDGHTLAPFFVSDPQLGTTQPYHVYFRREEPQVVFGSVDAGVANASRDGGATLLDDVWAAAPFANQRQFIAQVERVSGEWRSAGRLSQADADAVLSAARRAERELRAG